MCFVLPPALARPALLLLARLQSHRRAILCCHPGQQHVGMVNNTESIIEAHVGGGRWTEVPAKHRDVREQLGALRGLVLERVLELRMEVLHEDHEGEPVLVVEAEMKMGLEQMLALAVRRPQLQQVAPLPGWVNVTGDPGLLQKLSDLGHEDLGVNVWNGKMRDIAAARWLSFFKLVVRTCAELADERKLDRAQFMGDALRTLERRTAAASAYQLLGLGDLEDLDWVHPWTVPCYEPSSASRSELTEPK